MSLFSTPSADLPGRLLDRLQRGPAVRVRVMRTEGSAPRDAGTWMAVLADEVLGTIGGGHLEHQAIARAQALLADASLPLAPQRIALGPSLGQCCGGVVHLAYERLSLTDLARLRAEFEAQLPPVALFGGGHVGHALVHALAPLPFRLTWIDSREGVFPQALPPRVRCEHSEPVQAAVQELVPGSQVLIMSFSHAEDLDILAACLQRQRSRGDLRFIGLIGSRSKWASFRHRLESRGHTHEELAQVSCPIGLPGISGKEPEVIAAAVAAQLLMLRGQPLMT